MNVDNMSREEAVAWLKLSIEFGVDETLSEIPRNRLCESNLKLPLISKSHQISEQKQTNVEGKSDTIERQSVSSDDKHVIAIKHASACTSVSEIVNAIETFPYFVKHNECDEINFYEGPLNPFVIVFKEPEIYNRQSPKDRSLFDKSLLFNRILNSIDLTLVGKNEKVCASVVTFPLNFDYTEENRMFNVSLLQPFLSQYIAVLKPKVVICQGVPWLNAFNQEGVKNKKFLKNILILDFPSMDVLGRAPQRKKEVWRKILKLKKIYDIGTQDND